MNIHDDVNVGISLVIYNPNLNQLLETVRKLCVSILPRMNVSFFIVDNSPIDNKLDVERLISPVIAGNINVMYLSCPDNPGFGTSNNTAFSNLIDSYYYLVLNPDLEVSPDALWNAIDFMQKNPECGLLTPYATWKCGTEQWLCKRYPSVFDLLLRGFAPNFVKKAFIKRLSHYDMSDTLNSQDVYWDPPMVSGCFMLFKSDVFKALGGFDTRFFLYFEDFDLSLRVAQISRIAYVPQVKVVHHGGHASRKGWQHVRMFIRSMITFFNVHGWRWW